MNKDLNSFISFLETQHKNRSIYVWGAQGQDKNTISESWIRKRETSSSNANNAIAYWKKQVAAGYGDTLRAFDCSGLGMYFIQNLTGLSSGDKSANSMKAQCKTISRKDVKRGDWVFRVYNSGSSKGSAYHIGYVTDNALNVIEAKGRNYGVVKSHIDASKGYWNAFGRPNYFRNEIEGAAPVAEPDPIVPPSTGIWAADRVMKLTSPMMRGEDITALQNALLATGYTVGSSGADGVFGSDTETAIRAFQAAHGLEADGKAGEDTVTALGGNWQSSASNPIPVSPTPDPGPIVPPPAESWTASRVMKYTTPMMRGEDVTNLQNALIEDGYTVGGTAADGIFGRNTEIAVRAFQAASGLEIDGEAGEDTVTAIGGIWLGSTYDND